MSTQRKKFIALVDKAMADGVKMAPEELMFSYQGILYPATVCNPEVFKALESFEARDDDVFLAGYPKSGKLTCVYCGYMPCSKYSGNPPKYCEGHGEGRERLNVFKMAL